MSRSEEIQLDRIRRREEEERAKERELMLTGKLKPDQERSVNLILNIIEKITIFSLSFQKRESEFSSETKF